MSVVIDLKAIRGTLGWSQKDLAKRLGVSSFEVDFYERRGCLSEPMIGRLAGIVKASGITNGDEPGVKLRSKGGGGMIAGADLNSENDT